MMRPKRSWWQIPLWSPRHLLATSAVGIAALFLVGQLQDSSGATTTEATTAPTSASSPTTTSPSPSVAAPSSPAEVAEASPATPARTVEPATGVDAAEAFVEAWSRRYDPPDKWRSAVTNLSTPEFAKFLGKTNPHSVPATRSLGHAKVLSKSNGSRRVQVSTDSGPVAVTVKQSDGEWRVAGIEPVNTGR